MRRREYRREWMLSILHRELQSEARRPRTRWTRLVCTVIGFVACLALLFADRGGGGFGRRIFETLTFLAFWFSFIQGVRVAAGAIADEKRDGTLALLFLTPLTPLGLILGKFVAVAIPFFLPRRWEPAPVKSTCRFRFPKILMPKISLRQRAELLDRNPGEWLALRHGMNWVEQIPFIGLIAVLALAAGLLSTTGRPTSAA